MPDQSNMETNSNMSNTAQHYYTIGIVLTVIAAIFYSAKGVFIKLAYSYGMDTITVVALRTAFSIPFYILIGYFAGKNTNGPTLTISDKLKISALGICVYYIASFLDLLGLNYITANFERLIIYTYPTLVLIISTLLFRRLMQRREIALLAMTYIGVAIVFLQDFSMAKGNVEAVHFMGMEFDPTLLGFSLVFTSSITFAFYLVFSEKLINKVGSIRFTLYSMCAASVAILMHYFSQNGVEELIQTTESYLLIAFLALISTVIPSFMMSEGIKRIGASKSAMISCVGPISTLFLASLFLNEVITTAHILGMAIVIGSVLALSFLKPKTQ